MRSKQGREFTPKSKREEVGLLASIVRTISQIAGDLELGTIPPVAAETGCVTVDMQKDSSRYLIRGIVPVKKT